MGFWSYNGKLIVDGVGGAIYCDYDPCLEDTWGYFLCRRVHEGDKSDECAVDTYSCDTFEAPIVEGKIFGITACDVYIDCLEVGGGGGNSN